MMTYIIIFVTVIVSLICFKNRTLFFKLSLNPYSVIRRKQWFRVLTHGFVHTNSMHLIINMFVLLSFGMSVEYRMVHIYGMGSLTFVLLYVFSLIFSALPDISKYKNDYQYNSVGASGAVSAILFVSILFNPWGKLYLFYVLPIPSILFGVAYIIYSRYMSKRGGDNINHMSHVYGALFGILFMVAIKPSLIVSFFSKLFYFI
ncbi:MAG: rhomboid family intramembrane serine protease [Bacteroidetes bacterium]|nr:rhomboid family intramembrane serine protease [Bacteroidota bacterium]